MRPESIKITGPFDVLLDTTSGTDKNSDGTDQLVAAPIDLVDGLLFGRLESSLGEKVLTACEPAGLNHECHRQFAAKCAVVRMLPQGTSSPSWDEDMLIQKALALSRWIRPTSWGLDYAARVIPDGPGGEMQIIPFTAVHTNRHAFIHPNLRRDRLTRDDVTDLRNLLGRYLEVETDLPARVSRAMWKFEYVSRTYFVDIAWPLLAAALEGLINTHRQKVSLQFRERVAALAAAVGEDVTIETAKLIYGEIRSALVHGNRVLLGHAADLELFELATTVLRKALRRCVEDKAFRDHFVDEASVRAWSPVEGT